MTPKVRVELPLMWLALSTSYPVTISLSITASKYSWPSCVWLLDDPDPVSGSLSLCLPFACDVSLEGGSPSYDSGEYGLGRGLSSWCCLDVILSCRSRSLRCCDGYSGIIPGYVVPWGIVPGYVVPWALSDISTSSDHILPLSRPA
jgi:hypothetical protein